ncbi:DUF2987 domain-containing protein [Thalassotalea ponticola]|uniref:DUF2987 domain-containing protein n=1 Tax=Thalassotalea ponticola TaxID=1523392 RepID=UPI0025B6257B|nr:DUF2987 domain-containing protein [Thalassotalea ponticola]MDN3651401.1 DUF2987 domain-containing protein [Thalassotalea ponticola]
MKKIILATLAGLAVVTSAQAVDLEYKGFYQRLNLIEENQLDKITMGFYLVDAHSRQRCQLSKATMLNKSGNHDDIAIGADNQLMVPLSKSYYDNFSVLRVEQQEARQNCILQMQIQAKDKTQVRYSYSELAELKQQMQTLVDEFGGFLSFMMPDVIGVHIDMVTSSGVMYVGDDLGTALQCEQTVCKLAIDESYQSNDIAIEFSQPPTVIAPWIED